MLAQYLNCMDYNEKENVLSDAITRLLRQANLRPRDINYVCLHGTSTVLGDKYEAEQCRQRSHQIIRSLWDRRIEAEIRSQRLLWRKKGPT